MPTYSFKNSGKSRDQSTAERVAASPVPFGIKTPLALGSEGEGLLSMNFNIADQFADNLRNLILTNWGERLGLYNFGANLRPLTTEYTSQPAFDEEAIARIRSAVSTWLPYIELGTFESIVDYVDNKNTAVIKINITYNVPLIDEKDRAIQVVLYAI